MIAEIKRLRMYRQQSKQILDLASGYRSEFILQQIRNGVLLGKISGSLSKDTDVEVKLQRLQLYGLAESGKSEEGILDAYSQWTKSDLRRCIYQASSITLFLLGVSKFCKSFEESLLRGLQRRTTEVVFFPPRQHSLSSGMQILGQKNPNFM